MEELLHVYIDDVPVSWKRTRGKRHFEPTALKAWKAKVRDYVGQEIGLSQKDLVFPLRRRSKLSVLWLLASEESIEARTEDADNIFKGIADSLQKMLYPNDRLKYLRRIECGADVATDPAEIGVHIRFFAL